MYVFDQLLELKSEKYIIFNDLRIKKARNREGIIVSLPCNL